MASFLQLKIADTFLCKLSPIKQSISHKESRHKIRERKVFKRNDAIGFTCTCTICTSPLTLLIMQSRKIFQQNLSSIEIIEISNANTYRMSECRYNAIVVNI